MKAYRKEDSGTTYIKHIYSVQGEDDVVILENRVRDETDSFFVVSPHVRFFKSLEQAEKILGLNKELSQQTLHNFL